MIIMQGHDLERSFGATTLFAHINLEIQQNSRIGLVGPNGVGKSTLIKILTGQEAPNHGEVITPKKTTIGYIAQENNLNEQNTIFAEMQTVFAALIELEKQLTVTQNELAKSDYTDQALLDKYDEQQNRFEREGGFTYQAEIKSVLNGFNFDESTYDKPISVLSGGEKTRLSFVKLLLKKPQLLILDEPTNHLDLDTLDWLEGFLKSYPGAILAVSHDQYFLDAMATEILELRFGKLTKFKGNYSAYVQQRNLLDQQQEEAYEKQQAEIKHQEDFIQKNIVRATTTKRAQSRRKMLEKMERIEPPKHEQKVQINFKIKQQTGKEVLILNHVTVGYQPDQPMIQAIDLQVNQQNRVAVIGRNGIGKSTLLKTIIKKIPALAGEIKYGANLQIGYYDQEISQLDPTKTVIDTVWDRHKTMLEKDVRSVLASFLFHAEDLEKTVAQLSGGQRARLALTVLSLEDNNFLLMDEPTNHLDIEAKEVLEQALAKFPGTLLFVSHDRYFINELADTVVAVADKHATIFAGNYSYYLEKTQALAQKNATTETPKDDPVITNDYQKQKQLDSKKRKLARTVAKYEEEVDDLQQQIDGIHNQMAQPEIATNFDKLSPLQQKLADLQQAQDEATKKWEDAAETLDDFQD